MRNAAAMAATATNFMLVCSIGPKAAPPPSRPTPNLGDVYTRRESAVTRLEVTVFVLARRQRGRARLGRRGSLFHLKLKALFARLLDQGEQQHQRDRFGCYGDPEHG